MLGGVVTQTGTPWRPKLLAIERPLRFPPTTNAPVVSVMEGISLNRFSRDTFDLPCANHADAIIQVHGRALRLLGRDLWLPSQRRIASARARSNVCRQRIASTGQSSKRPARQECANLGP